MIRSRGLHTKSLSSRSAVSGPTLRTHSETTTGNPLNQGISHLSYACFTLLAYSVVNRVTPSHPGNASKFGHVCWFGVPHNCQIFSSWSKSDVPGNIGRRENISPNTQLRIEIETRKVMNEALITRNMQKLRRTQYPIYPPHHHIVSLQVRVPEVDTIGLRHS